MQSVLKKLVVASWFAIGSMALKADIVSAQEHYDDNEDLKTVLVNNTTATIAQKETPWIFVRPDGKSGFANDFTTNAISVVSEDGVNYYAHVEGGNGDRTKVIHFTVNENGIPSKHGDVIDTTASGEENNAEEMKKRKLIGVNGGYLYFYPTDQYSTSLIYDYETGRRYTESIENQQTGEYVPTVQKCLASCSDDGRLFVLCNRHYIDLNGEIKTKTVLGMLQGRRIYDVMPVDSLSDENRIMHYSSMSCKLVLGDSNGNVEDFSNPGVKLPGAISGISTDGIDHYVTSTATNAFYNLSFGQYNVVANEYGELKPMVPKTNDGLIRVIDNRSRGGKFTVVTTKGIHTIDE